MHWYYLLYMVIGTLAGLASGLFGIGGGIIVIPGLAFALPIGGVPTPYVMHMAIGTSMAAMIATASSSAIAHYKRGHIVWPLTLKLLPSIIIGLIAGAIFAHNLPSHILSILFGLFLFFMAYHMFFVYKPAKQHPTIHTIVIMGIGLLIGLKSGILGIGGGTIIIPFLAYCGISMRNAAGISAICTLAVATVGTACFAIIGWHLHLIPYSTGYVYWPAFVSIAIMSMLTAPLGAALSTRVPILLAKRLFSIILLFSAIKMIL